MQGISPVAKELLVSEGGFCSVGVARPLAPVQLITIASHNINHELQTNQNHLLNFHPFAAVI
jgi:hypothetical protein